MWIFIVITLIVCVGLVCMAWKRPGRATALLPLTAVAPIIAGLIGLEKSGVYLIPLAGGIALFVITVVMIRFKPIPELDREPWYKTFSRFFFNLFVSVLYLGLLLGIFQAFGPVLFILSMIFVFRYKQTRRYSQSLNVLSTISAAMRQNLPLPMALETAAANRKDPAADIYRKTAKYLCEGLTLTESLKRAYPKCPAEIPATLAAGEAMNRLPQAAEILEQDSIARISGFEKIRPVHPAYPLVVGTMALLIIFGLCVFIIPTFSEILKDMSDGEGALPASTALLLDFSRLMMRPAVITLIGLLLLFNMTLGGYIFNRPRRPERPRLLSRLGDWIRWHTPGLHYFEELCSLQRTIQGLRTGLEAGYSFDVIVRHTLRLDINACFRARLRRWLRQLEAGRPVADSAAACGLGAPLAWALDEKVNKGNTPELLSLLEEVYRNRYHYRLNIAHSIGWPCVVVVMGGCVGFVVFAMFSAIVRMTTITMDYSLP